MKTNIRSYLGLLLLLVAIVGWFAVVSPQISTYSSNSLALKSKQAELDSYNKRIQSLDSIRSQGTTITHVLQNLYLAMPKQSQIPDVLAMIDSIGGASGVVMSGVSLGTVSASASSSASISEVPVSVSFTGNLDSLNRFLIALRNNIRTVDIQNQNVTADASGNLSVTMQLGLVYQGGN